MPPPAIIGLETLLPLTLQLYHKGQGRADRPAAPPDHGARRSPGPAAGPPRQGRARRSAAVRSRPARAHRGRPLPQQIQELALRRRSGPGPRACAASSTGAPSSPRRTSRRNAVMPGLLGGFDYTWPYYLGAPARLSAGLDPLRPAADASGGPRRHPQDRLRQYRRHQRAAHRPQGSGARRPCCSTAARARSPC